MTLVFIPSYGINTGMIARNLKNQLIQLLNTNAAAGSLPVIGQCAGNFPGRNGIDTGGKDYW
jgi:hypothetical protein